MRFRGPGLFQFDGLPPTNWGCDWKAVPETCVFCCTACGHEERIEIPEDGKWEFACKCPPQTGEKS